MKGNPTIQSLWPSRGVNCWEVEERWTNLGQWHEMWGKEIVICKVHLPQQHIHSCPPCIPTPDVDWTTTMVDTNDHKVFIPSPIHKRWRYQLIGHHCSILAIVYLEWIRPNVYLCILNRYLREAWKNRLHEGIINPGMRFKYWNPQWARVLSVGGNIEGANSDLLR